MNKPASNPPLQRRNLQLIDAGSPVQPVAIDAELSIDRFIGSRIKRRREQLHLSQPAVAGKLGLSYQQLQKYERGDNRISAGQLFRLAQILDTTLSYFFPSAAADTNVGEFEPQDERGLAQRRENGQLVTAFANIRDPEVRRSIIQFVSKIGFSLNPPPAGVRRRGRPRKQPLA